MATRSLYASTEGIIRAKQAIARKRWTQQDLAYEVGLKTRQSIGRFLAGKAIERRIFIEICFQLDIDWQDIAAQPETVVSEAGKKSQDKGSESEDLERQVRSRYQDKIQAQCGTLQMWAVSGSLPLREIYIDVNILETLPHQRWLEIDDLLEGFDPTQDNVDRIGLNPIAKARLPGLDAVAKYPKLMLLGKPGTGKTTFLKYLALASIQGLVQPQRIPVFFWLKYFVESAKDINGDFLSLQDYIYQEFASCGLSLAEAESLLDRGKLLILLDGLDEVPESDRNKLLKQINRLSQTYYRNHFIITSRIAAQPYRFPGFTEVELANFTSQQIESFAQKFFVTTARTNREEGLKKAALFIAQLERSENRRIRELMVTPLLLNLACIVFQSKAMFPKKRSKLYKEGLELLLVRWDEAKGIQRDNTYRNLSLADKMKLLNYIGFISFEQGDYFFEQSKLQELIAHFLKLLLQTETDSMELQLDSEVVLNALESQHGLLVERARRIYSFSHLTFQEYLSARYIIRESEILQRSQSQSPNSPADSPLLHLVSHMTEKRWREVFLLVAEMLPQANELLLLMKQHIEQSLRGDEKLQQFLKWISQKSEFVLKECNRTVGRAFYFALALAFDHYFAAALKVIPNLSFAPISYFPLPLFFSLYLALDPNCTQYLNFKLKFAPQTFRASSYPGIERVYILEQIIQSTIDYDLALAPRRILELQQQLQALKSQLPDAQEGSQQLELWWQENNPAWTEQLKAVLLAHQDAGHHWQFNQQQTRSLQQYYNANKLLVDCWKSDCFVSAAVQQELEETLLLA
ncbi:MAG TPA: NACHT domain-containing NTPase [Chroococcales cyanobacterium]